MTVRLLGWRSARWKAFTNNKGQMTNDSPNAKYATAGRDNFTFLNSSWRLGGL